MEKETFKSELKNFAVNVINKYFPKVEEKFTDAKLTDGTIISYEADALAEGVTVMIVDETGTKLPAPIGNYVLEDGTQFEVVDDMGTVGTVIPAEAPAEEGEAPAAAPVAPTAQSAPQVQPKAVVESVVKETRFSKEDFELEREVLEEKFSKAVEKVEAEKAEIKEEFSKVKEMAGRQEDMIKELFTLISKLSDEVPAEKPTETRKNVFNAKSFRDEFKADLQKLRENINK